MPRRSLQPHLKSISNARKISLREAACRCSSMLADFDIAAAPMGRAHKSARRSDGDLMPVVHRARLMMSGDGRRLGVLAISR